MTRQEELTLQKLWRAWSAGKPTSNQTYRDFYHEVASRQREFAHINVFEVLDALVNAPPAPAGRSAASA